MAESESAESDPGTVDGETILGRLLWGPLKVWSLGFRSCEGLFKLFLYIRFEISFCGFS